MALTPQETFERAQRAGMPWMDLAEYEGEWVALRDGQVVASNLDVVALLDDAHVQGDDVLEPVPIDGPRIVIA
jgi:hypothetical protein